MNRHGNIFLLTALVLFCSPGFAQNSGSTSAQSDPKKPVRKATAPIEIIGTVIAHDGDEGLAWGYVDGALYLDSLVIRVEKKLKGQIIENYVRADFLGDGSTNLPESLFQGTQWKLKLEPVAPNHYRTCNQTIPPPPPSGSLEMAFGPRMIAVGGASSFPDPNELVCYVIKRENIEEISKNSENQNTKNP